jgi:hypothetical protein
MASARIIEPIDPDGRTNSRANLMRAWRDVLEREHLLDRIRARLTPRVADLLARPPAATEWLDVAYYECVSEAVLEELGEAELTRLTFEINRRGFAALHTRFTLRLVRLFGPNPHAVFEQIPRAASITTQNIETSWQRLGPRSGEFVMVYPLRGRIYPSACWVTVGAIRAAGEALGIDLAWDPPVIEAPKPGVTRTSVRVRW